jgi:hypothetical protein
VIFFQVGLLPESGRESVTGVVYRLNERTVTVSFDDYPDIDEPLTLVRLTNEVLSDFSAHDTSMFFFLSNDIASPGDIQTIQASAGRIGEERGQLSPSSRIVWRVASVRQ